MSEENITYKCSQVKNHCFYSVKIGSGVNGRVICDYIGVEGKRRGCHPEECNKYRHEKLCDKKDKKRFNKTNKL